VVPISLHRRFPEPGNCVSQIIGSSNWKACAGATIGGAIAQRIRDPQHQLASDLPVMAKWIDHATPRLTLFIAPGEARISLSARSESPVPINSQAVPVILLPPRPGDGQTAGRGYRAETEQ